MAGDPDFSAGLGVDCLDFGAGAGAKEPLVGSTFFDGRIERETLPADAIERRESASTPLAVAELVRYAQASGNDPLALAAVLRRPPNPLFDRDSFRTMPRLLMVNGDADAIACPDARLRAALGEPEYHALPGVDHLSLLTDPRFLHFAQDFVSR